MHAHTHTHTHTLTHTQSLTLTNAQITQNKNWWKFNVLQLKHVTLEQVIVSLFVGTVYPQIYLTLWMWATGRVQY